MAAAPAPACRESNVPERRGRTAITRIQCQCCQWLTLHEVERVDLDAPVRPGAGRAPIAVQAPESQQALRARQRIEHEVTRPDIAFGREDAALSNAHIEARVGVATSGQKACELWQTGQKIAAARKEQAVGIHMKCSGQPRRLTQITCQAQSELRTSANPIGKIHQTRYTPLIVRAVQCGAMNLDIEQVRVAAMIRKTQRSSFNVDAAAPPPLKNRDTAENGRLAR